MIHRRRGPVLAALLLAASGSVHAEDAAGHRLVAIAAGGSHSLAVDDSGRAWAWGSGDRGQLGDGSGGDAERPVRVATLTNAVTVAAGLYHSLALDVDGHVWAWGWNVEGQLGTGTQRDEARPVRVEGLPRIRAIAAGRAHSLAVDRRGRVWAWGGNAHGQLGDEGAGPRTVRPVQVVLPGRVADVSAGGLHSLAITRDGELLAWGDGRRGQLGNGAFGPAGSRATPELVDLPGAAASVAAGGAHSVVLLTTAEAWAWGENHKGQVGDGTTREAVRPVRSPGADRVAMLSTGERFNLAVTRSGAVVSWGDDKYGQLGRRPEGDEGTGWSPLTPGLVPGLEDVVAVAAGGFHALALDREGRAWAWGLDRSGALGDGPGRTDQSRPVRVAWP